MAWTAVVFERELLYKEVWAEPVRTVAKRYQLSDVGLRKICKHLGVPVPPLGYWARVAAGQSPRVTPLPSKFKGDTKYVRQVRVDEVADERAQRELKMLAKESPTEWPAISVKPTTDELHRLVVRTGIRTKHRAGSLDDLAESQGDDVLELRTTIDQRDRALRILDAIVSTALAAGAKIASKADHCDKVHLDVQGQVVQIRLEEERDRTSRQPTAAEKARQSKEPWYRPDVWTFAPSGRLKLTLFEQKGGNPYLTLRDGKSHPLEQRLDQVIPNLWGAVVKRRVEAELREEERERWDRARKRREELAAVRQVELERLKKTEELAQRWRRATELRQYADALQTAGQGESAAKVNQTLESEVAWIRNAADWLDPLKPMHWPEVDGDSLSR